MLTNELVLHLVCTWCCSLDAATSIPFPTLFPSVLPRRQLLVVYRRQWHKSAAMLLVGQLTFPFLLVDGEGTTFLSRSVEGPARLTTSCRVAGATMLNNSTELFDSGPSLAGQPTSKAGLPAATCSLYVRQHQRMLGKSLSSYFGPTDAAFRQPSSAIALTT